MKAKTGVQISRLPEHFDDWDGLLALISEAFAYMDGIVEPPSSARRLTPQVLIDKARQETCFIATEEGRLIGCIFASERADHIYVGKLAITPSHQRRAVGKGLLYAVEAHAQALGKPILELQTRIELTGNHAAFARLGFRETERTAHPGYNHPTSLTMRKQL
ncbi:MAG: GNAT family N-acetyltransferase [Rhizobiaceae bacterium]